MSETKIESWALHLIYQSQDTKFNKMDTAIRTTNLTFTYPEGTRGLKGISFEVKKGETVLIVGANGTGKSTLLLNLMGILRGEGAIEIFGVRLTKKNLAEVRQRIGLVFQSPDDQLFCPTVFDDVAFGPINLGYDKETVVQEVSKALSAVRMEGFEERSSHHLSFGEKKKVAIASVLSMNPEILLLDEPTGGLDPRSAAELIDILYQLKEKGKTILSTTHDLHFVSELADTVIVMNSGSIVAQDSAEAILSHRALLVKNNLVYQNRRESRKEGINAEKH